MAALSVQTGVIGGPAPQALTKYTLTTSDTLGYTPAAENILIVYNPTGSAITLTLAGALPDAAINIPGFGPISATGGKALNVAAGGFEYIKLDTLSHYLQPAPGTVTLTSSSAGLLAVFYAS